VALPTSCRDTSLRKLTADQQPVQLLATSVSSGRSAAVTVKVGAGQKAPPGPTTAPVSMVRPSILKWCSFQNS